MPVRICTKCHKVIAGDGIPVAGKYYHKKCLECAYCGQKLAGFFVTYKGLPYHTECNPASGKKVCAYCHKPITTSSYSLENKYYHKECYHQHIEKQCCVCGKPIRSKYYEDEWGNFSHTEHDGVKPRFCFCCGRIISGKPVMLGKDTAICSTCSSSSVTTDAQVEQCRQKVIRVFDELGITGIPLTIPISMKPTDEMEGTLGHIRYYKTRTPNLADFRIYMIYGLPRLYFQGVLAHEMLHSWLALYGREVTNDESEGFCNLGNAFIYVKDNSDFAHYLMKRMYKNADLVYGDGYRLQKQRYEKLGWAGLLESLRHK